MPGTGLAPVRRQPWRVRTMSVRDIRRVNDMEGVLGMAWNGLWAKAVPTVVIGVVGAAAYEVLREAVVKLPSREAAVAVTAWGMRASRAAERKAAKSAEQARLTFADVMAEARERVGEEYPPLTVADSGHEHDH